MKKIIGLLIITMIIGLYCKPITSKANEILEVGVKDIDPYGEFNYFRGISVEEYSGKPESIFYGVFDGLFENGVLSHEVTVKNTENTQFIFKYDYHYNDYHLDVAKVYLDGDLIYEAEFEEENLSMFAKEKSCIL